MVRVPGAVVGHLIRVEPRGAVVPVRLFFFSRKGKDLSLVEALQQNFLILLDKMLACWYNYHWWEMRYVDLL